MIVKFQDLERFDACDIEAAIARNDPAELPLVPVIVALSSRQELAQSTCVRLADHPDPRVRGNAVLSLGHLARRFRSLEAPVVKPLIERALQDRDGQVRILAESAADEIHQFLHWTMNGHVYG